MRRILIVDDSRTVRQALEASLEPWGFELDMAENGAVALQRLRAAPFDLVFLDINMPVLDGPSLLRVMRAQGIGAKVVLVTSGASSNVVASTVRLGAADYVGKPFTPQKIRDVISRVLDLDLAALAPEPPRVLVQSADEGLPGSLRALLPPHVILEAVPTLAACLDRAEEGSWALVLLGREVAEGADLVRARQPVAGIFVVADGADPQRAHAPDGALDGVLPRGMDGDFVHGFLRANYTRPLVWVENHLLRAAGFEGNPHQNWIGAYFTQLGRTLCARAEREAAVAPDVAIDLRSVPADGDRAAALIATVRDHLDALGAAPVFTVTPELRKALAPREEIKRAVIVESP
jgi:CheY-like chemotaxis protein